MGVVSLRSALAALALSCAPLALQAQEYRLSPQDLLPQSNYEFDLPTGAELANPKGMEAFNKMAEEIRQSSTAIVMKDLQARGIALGILPDGQTPAEALAAAAGEARLPEGYRVTIFVSRAMGEGALRDLMSLHRNRKDVRFVFRGVPDGMSVPEFGWWLKELLSPDGDLIQDLNINLDPELFDLAGAEMAPTMILEDLNQTDTAATNGKDVGKIMARAVGFNDPDWLYERMQKGQTDERSNNAVPIEEEDLRVRAEREAAAVASRFTRDPEVLKSRYWDRQAASLKGMRVMPAGTDRRRVLHFMYRAGEEIKDNDGKVLAFADEVFQPHDVLPFDRRIFVFNPNIEREVRFVEEQLQTNRAGVSRIMLIVTEVPQTQPGQEPWDGLQALIDRFGVQVFLLNDHFRTSFSIEATPTEIFPEQGNGRVEVISEEWGLL